MSQASAGDPLDAETLQRALTGQLIGNRVVVVSETTSTNDLVAELAAESREGLVVFAEHQTAGRGQYGRRWDSATHKGLWLSVLLRPRIELQESSKLTDLLATTILETVTQAGCAAARIKPPNDVYIAARKIAGVLVEMRVQADGSYCAVAGMGLNVNHRAEDFPEELRDSAGSLALTLGHAVDRHAFAIGLLRTLEVRYRRFTESAAKRAAS